MEFTFYRLIPTQNLETALICQIHIQIDIKQKKT